MFPWLLAVSDVPVTWDTDETVYGAAIPNTPHRYRYKKSAFPQPLPALPMSTEVAYDYMRDCMRLELRMRICDARVDTFMARLEALPVLTNFFRAHPVRSVSGVSDQKPLSGR